MLLQLALKESGKLTLMMPEDPVHPTEYLGYEAFESLCGQYRRLRRTQTVDEDFLDEAKVLDILLLSFDEFEYH